jgi:hypothetical protein
VKQFIIAAVLASAATAHAQEAGAPEETKKDKKDKDAKDEDELDIEGRVFVRSTLSRVDISSGDDPFLHDLAIASARLTADYRRGKTFKVVIEAELADNDLDLKDVFVRARLKKDLHLVAGQFKKPISPIALESSWRLPTIERGLLGDLDSASTPPRSSVPLPFGGRGIGVGAEMDLEGGVPIQLTAAVFEHSIIDPDPIDMGEAMPFDPFLRGRIEPAPEVRFGATVALVTHRNSDGNHDPEGVDHAPLGSLDAEVERGPVKVWLETFLGGSTIYEAPTSPTSDDFAQGTMYGARGLVALRVDDLAPWLLRLEPFVAGSFIDPHLSDDADHGLQGATGVALLFHERLRFQVEAEGTKISDDSSALGQVSRFVLYTQLGGVF